MSPRLESRLAVALAAAAMAWVAVWSWGGLVEHPTRFIGPAFVAALLIALVGGAVRSTRAPWPVALLAQVVVLAAWFQHRQGTEPRFGGWVPTTSGIRGLVDQVRDGAAQVNHYAAPVAERHEQAAVYLLAVAVLLILAVDLIAGGLRRAPWSGLPIIVALTVPISVLDGGLAAPVFVLTGILFALLLATAETDRVLAWGHDMSSPLGRQLSDRRLGRASMATSALRIAGVTAVSALVLPLLVPVGAGVLDGDKDGRGGESSGSRVTLTNPLVDLRRDLVSNKHLPLLYAETTARDPSYVRLSVLDRFTGKRWEPSSRELGSENNADGSLPAPPGMDAPDGRSTDWSLRTDDDFNTSWLPLPYVSDSIAISSGQWRYGPPTMDIASAAERPPAGVSYFVTAHAPTYDPAALDAAPSAARDVLEPMTKVPDLLDSVTQIAKDVTATGTTDYAKVVLLQDWFRRSGGFQYSLAPGVGAGMAQLERFITTEKSGYCEQFAAAMAVMARALGIPARVVVGFLNPRELSSGSYEYTTDDLHAWPEIYFAGSGWVRFEPTPSARTGIAPPWTSRQIQAPTPGAPTAAPSISRPTPSAKPRPETAPTTSTEADSSSPFSLVLLVLLAVPFVLALPALLRRGRRRRRLGGHDDDRASALALWAELRATAIDLGLGWPDGRSVRAVASHLLAHPAVAAEHVVALERLSGLVERALYSREFTLTGAERDEALADLRTWCRLLGETAPWAPRMLARVAPRSVFTRDRHDAPAVLREFSDAG